MDQLRLAVDEDRLLGADLFRTVGDARDVRLVGLAEVGGQRVGDRALLPDPRDRDGRVETAGKGDPDALADRQGREDAGHGRQRRWLIGSWREPDGAPDPAWSGTPPDVTRVTDRPSRCARRQRTASTARSNSATEKAPSSFVRIMPVRSTTYVNGSDGSLHSLTQRLTPFAGSLLV